MKRASQKILFILTPLWFVLMLITSNEPIIPILENTFIAPVLYKLSFPNSIIFSISIGYLMGAFIYFLTAYLPEKKRQKYQDEITKRLLEQILNRINYMIRTIIKCSGEDIREIDFNIDLKMFKKICQKCHLDETTGAKKIIRESPLVLGDILVREALVNDWNIIISYLNEIDFASIYIEPEIYNLCLRIRKCTLSLSIRELIKKFRNTDLGAWSSQFHELHELGLELNEELVRIQQ